MSITEIIQYVDSIKALIVEVAGAVILVFIIIEEIIKHIRRLRGQ